MRCGWCFMVGLVGGGVVLGDVLVGFLVVVVVCVPRCQGGGWFGFGVAVMCTLDVWWFCVGIRWF